MNNRRRARLGRHLALSIALIAATTAVVVTPSEVAVASGGDGITAYLSAPFVQGPDSSLTGVVIETFNDWLSDGEYCRDHLPTISANSPVGTFTGNCRMFFNRDFGGATTTSGAQTVGGTRSGFPQALDAAPSATGGPLVLTFAAPVKYIGFWWSAGSSNDKVIFYNEDTELATYTAATLNGLLGPAPASGAPIPDQNRTFNAPNGGTYFKDYYYGPPQGYSSLTPQNHVGSTEPFAYLNLYASGSIAFTKVEFIGPSFEFDNVAISVSEQTPPVNQVFIQSVLGKSVSFIANGGIGSMPAQTSTSTTSLSANTFTRPGYTFIGWHTNASGTGGTTYVAEANFDFATDLTLYAQWTPVVLDALPSTPTETTAPPATTVPDTAPPAPVPTANGSLPTLRSTETLVTEDGQPVTVELVVENDEALVLRNQDFELRLRGACTTGCTITANATGRETIHLDRSGGARVSGFGFLPGREVHVWIFSEPTYLGALLVAPDGTYEGTFPLDGIAVGEHTLQANGFSFDNLPRSANLGIVVVDNAPATPGGGQLPATGSGNITVILAVGMFGVGALLLTGTRRRARSA